MENHDALHASVEDMEGLDDGQEDDLPEPEKLAVVQVIVNQEQPPSVQKKCQPSFCSELRSSPDPDLTIASDMIFSCPEQLNR